MSAARPKKVTSYQKTEAWVDWILKPKSYKYFIFGAIFSIVIFGFSTIIYANISKYMECGETNWLEIVYFTLLMFLGIIGIFFMFRTKIGEEKITISNFDGMKLVIAASDRPNLLTLTDEDGLQTLVTKEQVLDIIKSGGRFIKEKGVGVGSTLNGRVED